MEELRIMVQNIVVVIVLALLLELLLPAGDMRRYVHLVCGLLVIVVVFQSIGALARVQWTDFPSFGGQQAIPDVIAAGQQLREKQLGAARESFRQAMRHQIQSLVEVGGEWQVVEVELGLNEEEENIFRTRLNRVDLTVRPARAGKSGFVDPVPPVRVGAEGERQPSGNREVELAAKVARLQQQLARIYQLRPEQVVVKVVS